jgi:uncharacterized protein YecE (DUF72 family)
MDTDSQTSPGPTGESGPESGTCLSGRLPYRLGLPAWAFPAWRGRYFPAERSPLDGYARVFNAVEGNTTFYRVPDENTVRTWADAVAGSDFKFCFKLPREVTHERPAHGRVLDDFLAAIAPLEAHLGPLLVQFPAWAGPDDLRELAPLFDRLPAHRRHVLEVRHPAFFADPGLLEEVLDAHGLGRVVLDSRPLYQGDRSHPEVARALHEKPDVPVDPRVTNGLAFLRLILHPDEASNEPWLKAWAGHVAGYLRGGVETWVMIHCPNNGRCPALAERFHALLRGQPGMDALPDLPPWPLPQQGTLL